MTFCERRFARQDTRLELSRHKKKRRAIKPAFFFLLLSKSKIFTANALPGVVCDSRISFSCPKIWCICLTDVPIPMSAIDQFEIYISAGFMEEVEFCSFLRSDSACFLRSYSSWCFLYSSSDRFLAWLRSSIFSTLKFIWLPTRLMEMLNPFSSRDLLK